MDRPIMTPRSRALLAFGAGAVLLTATIGSAAARADLRPESTDPGTIAIGVRDDEHESNVAVTDETGETDEPEVEAPETTEPDEAAAAKEASQAAHAAAAQANEAAAA